jgi:hypothetical protein
MLLVLSPAAAAMLMAAAVAEARADEGELEEAIIFFELNHTDGDLGIHALIDGDAWKRLVIEVPGDRQALVIRLGGGLRRQGLTELFFESAEPTFDELSPEEFFNRFPEGEYEVEALSLEGDILEGEAEVTHLMPAPVGNLRVNGVLLPENCDAVLPVIGEPYTVTWHAVTMSHPDLGRTSEPIVVDKYQVVMEREDGFPLDVSIDLPPSMTMVGLPAGLTTSGEVIKIEVLVREEGGNQTAVESCFEVN